MSISQSRPRSRDNVINIRVSQQERALIDQAAQALGRSRSDFMLESACQAATAVLLNQTYFRLDPDKFAEFQALLDEPPPPTDALRRLLHQSPPWE